MSFITDIHNHVRDARRFVGASDISYPCEPKKYPRFPQIPLALPIPLTIPLTETLQKRISAHSFSFGPVPFSSISHLFGHGIKIRSDAHRPYPAGGGLYPIETYLLAFTIESLSRSIFHYHPQSHVLEELWKLDADNTPRTFASTDIEPIAGMIIFTALWERSAQKYRDFAYHLALLEAGHLCQNLALLAVPLGLGLRPFAGFNDQAVADVLDLDTAHEQPVYSALIGCI